MQDENGNIAYDLSLFDDTARERVKEPTGPIPKIVKRVRKSDKQLGIEAHRVNAKAFRIVSIVCLLLFAVGALTVARAQLTEKTDELAKAQSRYSVASSEHTRLDMELNALVSLDNVETYARDVLGMTKQEKYQVEYVDLSVKNKLILSEIEEKGFFEKVGAKINEVLEYIF